METTIFTVAGNAIGTARIGDNHAIRSLVRDEYGTDQVTVYYMTEGGAWAWWSGGGGGGEGMCDNDAVPVALRTL